MTLSRLLFAALVLLSCPLAAATDVRPAASLAAPLDNQGSDARSLGMGSALMGLKPEAAAQLWNPAGLARLGSAEASLHHHSWLADIMQESLALGLPLGSWGSAGLSVNYTGFGTFERRAIDGRALGTFEARRLGGGLAWAREFGGELSVGLGLRGFRQDMDDWAMSALGMDLGAIYRPEAMKRLAIGVSSAGAGATGDGSALAGGSRVSLAWDQSLSGQNSFLLALGAVVEPRGANRLQVGVELDLSSVVFARGGYQARFSDEKVDGLQGLSIGLGAGAAGMRVDYAWIPYGELGTTHRISVVYRPSFHSGSESLVEIEPKEKPVDRKNKAAKKEKRKTGR